MIERLNHRLTRFVAQLTLLAVICYQAHGTEEPALPEPTKLKLNAIYERATRLFADCNETYRSKDRRDDFPAIELCSESGEPPAYVMYGSLTVQVQKDSLEIIDVGIDAAGKGHEPSLPTHRKLTLEAAIQAAKSYLKSWNIALPVNTALTTAKYDGHYRSCWELRWTRTEAGYPWDDFDESAIESVYVIFNESQGLVGIGNYLYTPSPKSFEVKLSREEAIGKAEKYVPLVQRTPFYREARKEGFVVNGIKSCDLKVAAPNWLLDPARAIWLPKKPPAETRLCWVVRFTTADSLAGERNLEGKNDRPVKLVPPEIVIYLDAGTGDVVGANFT